MISRSNSEALMGTALASSRDRSAWPGGVRWWLLGAVGALLVGFSGKAGVAQVSAQLDPDARIEVEVRNGLASLKVRNAPVAEVIRRIGEEAGFETVVLGPLDGRITGSFTKIPVYDAVRRLARETIFVMIHAPGGPDAEAGPIMEVRLYRSAPEQPAPSGLATAQDGVDQDLLAELSQDDAQARIRAVQKLGRTGEAAAIAVLERVLSEDGDSLVRGQSAAALGRIGSERVIPALQAALADQDQSVRVQAVRGFGRLGGERSAQILGEVLLYDADRRLRRTAAWSLGQLDSELARSYLDAAARDSDSVVRKTAKQVLGRWEEAAEEASDEP
jgi:hypothetical protein